MLEEFYAPKDIQFHHLKYKHLKWLLRNLDELKNGGWPQNPYGNKRIDGSVQKVPNSRAYFCTPCDYAAYIEMRLNERGMDGLLVKAKYVWDENLDNWSAFFQLSRREINHRINETLKYIVEVSKE